jgi:hypothetical protein
MIEYRTLMHRKIAHLLLVGAGFVLLLFMSPVNIKASEGTHIIFEPPLIELSSTPVTVNVKIEDVQDLYGLQLDLYFDPTIVTVESIAPGDFLDAGFVLDPKIDVAAGKAFLAYTQLAPQPARSGSGTIAVLTLRQTSCAGLSPLKLANVILSDRDGQAIPHTLNIGAADSGVALMDRRISGLIFHDVNEDGIKSPDESGLAMWPVYLQRLAVEPVGAVQMAISGADGVYEVKNLTCGRYQLWSENGTGQVVTRTIDIPSTADLQVADLPMPGPLVSPLQHIFLPSLLSQ